MILPFFSIFFHNYNTFHLLRDQHGQAVFILGFKMEKVLLIINIFFFTLLLIVMI
jgi:hypothetical protein